MLKQKSQLFELLFMAVDLIVISAAWIIAYWIRFMTDWVPVDKGVPEFRHYVFMLFFIWIIWALVFRAMGLYRPMRGAKGSREIFSLVNANFLAVLILIAITYLYREKSVPYSRLVFLYFGGLAILFTSLQRMTLRGILREARRRGYNLRYMLIVGAGKVAADVASRIRLRTELGIQLLGCLSKTGQETRGPWGIPILGAYSDLKQLIKDKAIDQVVVALPLEDNLYLPDIMGQVQDSLVDVRIVPDIYQFVSVGGAIEEFEGLPVISVQESPITGLSLGFKRLIDLLISGFVIILIFPILILLAVLVKLSSRGPIFYQQERVSYDGSPFKIIKFRTMRLDAERDGPGWTTPNDSRVTWIGKILRSTSLDELPQLLNVLRGEMSIVGPRPERPVFIEEFRKRLPHYMLRHKVPAGITGWAQIHGWRGDTSIDKRLEFDLYYIENWSLLLDLKILLLTIIRGFKNKNAY